MKNPSTELTDEFLETALGDSFAAWKAFCENLPNYDISLEWRYYKDGGWLAKITHKKKTIIWGSATEGFFTVSFLFSEKPFLRAGIMELDISDDVKKSIQSICKEKYFAIKIEVRNESQLSNVYKLIEYKKRAK